MRTDGSTSTTLPRPLSSFVGREDVLADLVDLLRRNRLLTLTGPGGSGKTRLSIELAARVAPDHPDGVHFVPLAAIRDPDLLPSAVARALGLQDPRRGDLVDHLANHLSGRRLLLVLDNFEQVLGGRAAGRRAAGGVRRRLKMLVTSRAVLHLSGEHEFPVPPLPLPDPERRHPPLAEPGAQYAAVHLFVERARRDAARVRGRPTRTRPAVAEICAGWTACRWPSSWPPRAVKLLAAGGVLARLERPAAAADRRCRVTCPPGSRRCGTRSPGATTC